MKISVVISACPNRAELFDNALYTYTKQNFSKKDFEIVLVDDGNNNELFELCREYHKSSGLQSQYIRIDPSKSFYPVKSFSPTLTSNIGFRISNSEVIVITGPETLQSEDNLIIAYSMKDRRQCGYGLVFRASMIFNNHMKSVNWKKEPFINLLQYPGARADCRSCPPHPPGYWYCVAVARGYIMEIHGADEKFLGGICGDDDDFANRMRFLGVEPVFEHKIIGIHQNHDIGDEADPLHNIRQSAEWKKLRNRNFNLMNDNIRKKDPIANENHVWGDLNLITDKEVLR